MKKNTVVSRLLAAGAASLVLCFGTAQAEQIKVMNSGGFSAAYKALAPKFAAASGDTLDIIWGPSMGKSPQAIPNRLQRGEEADVVIMVGYALDDLIKQGKVLPDSRVDLAESRIGLSVKAGSAKPDISSAEAFKAALLSAKSIAYSDSASGVYIESTLFKKLGIEDQVKAKARMVPRIPVASVVADGQFEIGLQQVSELLPVAGAEFVGRIPEQLQSVTTFAAGIPVGAKHPDAARALIRYLASPAAQADVLHSGLDIKQ